MPILIPWLPEKMTVTYTWPTDIISIANGRERRISLSDVPDVKLALEYNMVGDEMGGDTGLARQVVRGNLVNDPNEAYEIPLRYEAVFITDDVASGANTASINYARARDWARIGMRVYVEVDEGEDGYSAEIVNAVHVGAALNLTLGTVAPADLSSSVTRVCPLVAILPLDHQALGRYQVERGTWTLSGFLQTFFLVDQGGGISLDTFEGLPVFSRPALQEGSAQIGEDFSAALEVIGGVRRESDTLYAKAKVLRNLTFMLDGIDDWHEIKALLFTTRGPQVPFFRSTLRDDLYLSAQPGVPTNDLLLTDLPSYLPWYEDADTYACLALTLSDGTVAHVRVTAVVDNLDGTLTATLDDPLDRGTATIDSVSFLEATRVAADSVVLTYQGGVLAGLALQTLTGDYIRPPA